MQIPLPLLFTILCAFCGLLLGTLLLVSPYYRSLPNRYLAYCFWTISLIGITYSLVSINPANIWFTLFNDIMWEFLLGAFIFLHFAALLNHPLATSRRRQLLYFPFYLTLIINLVVDLDLDFGLIDIGVREPATMALYYLLESISTILYTLVLVIWSWRLIEQHLRLENSSWAKSFWRWCIGITLTWALGWALEFVWDIDITTILYTVMMVMFFWVGYRGVVQLKLAEEKRALSKLLVSCTRGKGKSTSAKATSITEQLNPYLAAFTRLMEEEKLYRNPSLNRDYVAEQLGISSSHLSTQLSGSSLGSFTDLVNSWRVEEVKQLLLDPAYDQYSLLAIGLEAGFNSKSAFYQAFRKETGRTPSAYKKARQAELSAASFQNG